MDAVVVAAVAATRQPVKGARRHARCVVYHAGVVYLVAAVGCAVHAKEGVKSEIGNE